MVFIVIGAIIVILVIALDAPSKELRQKMHQNRANRLYETARLHFENQCRYEGLTENDWERKQEIAEEAADWLFDELDNY